MQLHADAASFLHYAFPVLEREGALKDLLLLAAALFVLFSASVVVNFLRVRRHYSGNLIVTCPATQKAATIRIKAAHAARTSLTGQPDLKVESCDRWGSQPVRCPEGCLVEEEALFLDRAESA
jgi:hypothetical protein